jgi:hypothetical protein
MRDNIVAIVEEIILGVVIVGIVGFALYGVSLVRIRLLESELATARAQLKVCRELSDSQMRANGECQDKLYNRWVKEVGE